MQTELIRLMERLCSASAEDPTLNQSIVSAVEAAIGGPECAARVSILKQCFDKSNEKAKLNEKNEEFEMIEKFVREEHEIGKQRRGEARRLSAAEEKRLAVEIAALRSIQVKSDRNAAEQELQEKISNAERSYMSRKMVVAKATMVASADCRLQFSRTRAFMETLHKKRLADLYREYKSGLFHLQLVNHLEGKDARVCALEEQVAQRLYEKKKADANEYHMAQSIEEAQYLESVIGLLDKVQNGKEDAAKSLFALQVTQLKEAAASAQKRKNELEVFYARSKMEIAELTASCFLME